MLLAQFTWPPRPANKTSLQKDRPPTSSSISLLLLSKGRRQINIFKSQIPGTKITQWNFPLKLSFANNEIMHIYF